MAFGEFNEGSAAVIELISKEERSSSVPKEELTAERYKLGLWRRLNAGVSLNFLCSIYRFCLTLGVNSFAEWTVWYAKHRKGFHSLPIDAALEWSNVVSINRDEWLAEVDYRSGEPTNEEVEFSRHDIGLKTMENEIIPVWVEDTKDWLLRDYIAGDRSLERAIVRHRKRLEEVVALTEKWLVAKHRAEKLAAELSKPGAEAKEVFARFGCTEERE